MKAVLRNLDGGGWQKGLYLFRVRILGKGVGPAIGESDNPMQTAYVMDFLTHVDGEPDLEVDVTAQWVAPLETESKSAEEPEDYEDDCSWDAAEVG